MNVNLKNLGANKTELHKDGGTVVFYSYETPVAACVDGIKYVRTDRKYSVTTSKHINQWLDGVEAETVTQSYINTL